MLNSFEIRMTSPAKWEVIVDGKRLNGVRALTLEMEVGCVSSLFLDMATGEGSAEGEAVIGGLPH